MQLDDTPSFPYWAQVHPTDIRRAGGTPEEWLQFVETAHDWIGNEEWVFHGTSEERWRRIATDGLVAGPQRIGTFRGDISEVDGVCFGDVRIALYHSIFRHRHDHSLPILIAARLGDLEDILPLLPDQAAVELPFENQIERSFRQVADAWTVSEKDWRSSLEVAGSLVAGGSIPSEFLQLIDSAEALERLHSHIPRLTTRPI